MRPDVPGKTILVTGAAGLIGHAVVLRLAQSGRAVMGTDMVPPQDNEGIPFVVADVRDSQRHVAIMQDGCDGIIHCGGISGPMLERDNPSAVIDINVAATTQLLELARAFKLRRVVACSSVAVYGETDPHVELVTETTAMRVWDIYGASKIAAEAVLQGYVRQCGVSAVGLRIGWVYGPARRTETILSAMIRAGLGGMVCEQAHGADHHLQFVHVDDVVDGLIAAFDAEHLARPVYNLVAGPRVTVATLADMVRRHLPEARISIGPGSLPGEAAQADISSGAAAADFGWRPKVGLAEGIAAYIAWLRHNPF